MVSALETIKQAWMAYTVILHSPPLVILQVQLLQRKFIMSVSERKLKYYALSSFSP